MKTAETLALIRAETDSNRKNLLVATLVSDLFRAAGADPVIVGGSAVEVYTEGRYVSGDVDICFTGARLPSPRNREDVMSSIGKSLGVRQWSVDGVMVDVLGAVETTARTPFQEIGGLKLIQIEDLIAERILVATQPHRSAERLAVAKTLLTAALAGLISIDMQELNRVAASPDYEVSAELNRLSAEIKLTHEPSS